MSAKVLVVDDEPDLEQLILQKFRKQIRQKEYEFMFAPNGVAALAKLAEATGIDVVLTDINMPEMDGLTLLSKLREDSKLLKPVVVSAYGDMENIRTAMNRGAFDFVTKPIDLTDLEVTLAKAIDELNTLKNALKSRDQLIAIQQELDIATAIQTSILPQKFPAFPDRQQLDIYAKMITAKEVGGDFYDFFAIDKNRIGFTVGDVSGKGVPAAMFMAVSRTLLKSTALKGIPPDECLRSINNILEEESPANMFVTIFYGVLDTRSGAVEYCNGGHNLPCLLHRDGSVEKLRNIGGVFVGAFKDMEFESKVMILQPGETLVLYTDGVTEAADVKDEMFDDKRLEKCLQSLHAEPVQEIPNRVITAVKEFSSGVPQSDDITVLALRYNG